MFDFSLTALNSGYIDLLSCRMDTGLTKLLEATDSVNELSKELVVKEKELAVASKEAEAVLAEVAVKAASAEKVPANHDEVVSHTAQYALIEWTVSIHLWVPSDFRTLEHKLHGTC